MFDDSVGLKMVEHISENELDKDKGFAAIDLSGDGLNLLSYLSEDVEKIVLVDTAKMGKNPGEFSFFVPEVAESTKSLAGFSTHEGDMIKVLTLAKESGYYIPEIIFMGIEPHTIKNEFGLSSVLAKNFNKYVDEAISKLVENREV